MFFPTEVSPILKNFPLEFFPRHFQNYFQKSFQKFFLLFLQVFRLGLFPTFFFLFHEGFLLRFFKQFILIFFSRKSSFDSFNNFSRSPWKGSYTSFFFFWYLCSSGFSGSSVLNTYFQKDPLRLTFSGVLQE